jgi:hypothetical protein
MCTPEKEYGERRRLSSGLLAGQCLSLSVQMPHVVRFKDFSGTLPSKRSGRNGNCLKRR